MDQILLHHLPKKSGGSGLRHLLDKINEESISGITYNLCEIHILKTQAIIIITHINKMLQK